jgi:hypothetical protein
MSNIEMTNNVLPSRPNITRNGIVIGLAGSPLSIIGNERNVADCLTAFAMRTRPKSAYNRCEMKVSVSIATELYRNINRQHSTITIPQKDNRR